MIERVNPKTMARFAHNTTLSATSWSDIDLNQVETVTPPRRRSSCAGSDLHCLAVGAARRPSRYRLRTGLRRYSVAGARREHLSPERSDPHIPQRNEDLASHREAHERSAPDHDVGEERIVVLGGPPGADVHQDRHVRDHDHRDSEPERRFAQAE